MIKNILLIWVVFQLSACVGSTGAAKDVSYKLIKDGLCGNCEYVNENTGEMIAVEDEFYKNIEVFHNQEDLDSKLSEYRGALEKLISITVDFSVQQVVFVSLNSDNNFEIFKGIKVGKLFEKGSSLDLQLNNYTCKNEPDVSTGEALNRIAYLIVIDSKKSIIVKESILEIENCSNSELQFE
jgi:hypothetical protein